MKQTTVNEFKDGLNLDLHPLVTPKTVLTDNINGTFITYNGNEFCLQNDRGNKYVTSLTPGYTPIGIKEHNGILYIVSVSENKTEIGTFPSPDYPELESDYNLEQEFNLINEYKPLHVLENRLPLTEVDLGYTVNTPVTIEIQDSYDGSVNLILVANECKPRIINSGFSVASNNKYKFIKRRQSVETNIYTDINKESELIRTSDIITNVQLLDIKSGGQFKGGNYTFYIKFGDSDFNQTDIVAESGIVSVFNGNNAVPSTISGTLLDERTDKMIGLGIMGLNPIYSKIYIYYSREYSDTQGYRMTEYGMFNEPIDLNKNSTYGAYIQTTDPATGKPVYTQTMIQGQEIWLTGFEQTTPIDPEILNIDYHTIDWARAEAQHSNMLFLGNVGQKETFELYTELDDLAKEIQVTVAQDTLQAVDTTYSFGSEYYDVHNIYDKVGYYPGEIYRFGIVYILKDGSKTPVFNMKGKNFQTNAEIEDGVFLMPDVDIIYENQVKPIYLTFNVPPITNDNVLGWFIVRQKRIPNTICEGLSIAIDKTSNVPVIWDGKDWITQSFLDGLRGDALIAAFPNDDTPGWQDSRDVQLKYNNYDFAKYNFSNEEFQEWLNSKNYHYTDYWVSLNNAGDMYSANESDITQTATLEVKLEEATRSIANKYKASHPDEITWDYNKVFIPDTSVDEQSAQDLLYSILLGQPFSVNWYRKYEYGGLNDQGQPISIPSNIYAAELKIFNVQMDYEGEIVTNDQDWYTSLYNSWVSAYRSYLNVSNLDRKILREWKCIDYWKEANALLSLDPCVNQGIAGILDGSKFNIRLEREATVDPDQSVWYRTEVSNVDTLFELNNTKCVFVPSNTGAKVVDGYEFSNIAGNGTSTERFKYFTFPDGVFEKGKNNTRGRAEMFRELKRDIDNENVQTITEKQKEELEHLYRTNLNINLIRGLFAPYIGLANKSRIPMGVYSIKHKNALVENDFLVRKQDQSEYYTVSEYKRATDRSVNVYRGDCFTNTITMRIIRNFIDNTAPISDVIVDPNAWNDWVVRKDLNSVKVKVEKKDDKTGPVKYDEVNLADVNTVDLGIWLTFKCLSSYNLGLRSLDTFHTDEMALMGTPRTFHPLNTVSTSTGYKTEESFLLNDGLSASVGRKRYNIFPKDAPYSKSEFSNRIMFSNVHVTDAFTNGYRTFQGMSYKDYDKQYGAITKLISLGQNIFVVMEHGLGLVPVNPKALMQTTTGEAIHIYGYGVLPDEMTIISQDYGSKYEHSVIRTPIGIYGVDVDAKKVWRYSDKQGFQTISDMKIETYLKDYLTQADVQMGLKDIRTHYNAKKGDIMFTFYTIDPSQREAFVKKYFYIDKSQITVLLNKPTSIKCSTNMDDTEIEITCSDNLNCTYKNGVIELIGVGLGIGKIYVNGEQKLEIIVKEQQDTPDTTDSIEISKQALLMQVGQSYQLSATTNISNPQFVWTSSDDSIVRIDSSGRITAITIGRALISVTVEGSSVSTSCIVTVQIDPIRVTGVSLDKTKVYVEPSGTFILNPIIIPDNATNKLVTWNVDGNLLATGEPNTFRATSIGSGSVTVVTNDGGYTSTVDVIISDNIPVSKIEITPRTMLLYQGQQGQFNANVYPESASNKTIKWAASQDSKISVDQTGCVTAVNVGSVNVIAKSEDEKVQAIAPVTILQNPSSRIALSKKSLSIKVGEIGSVISTLYCKIDDWVSNVFPNVNYEIANKSIAKITSNRDQEVFIEGVSRGVTTIKFTAKDDPSITASCEIIVTEGKLTLSTTYENVFPRETKKVTIIEKEGDLHISQNNGNVSYRYENNAIYLTGNTVGTTIFTISDGVTTVELEGETQEIIPLNDLIFDKEIPDEIVLRVGETFHLGYKFDPEDYTRKKYGVSFFLENAGDVMKASRGDRPQVIYEPELWGDSDVLTSWTALRPGSDVGHIEIWDTHYKLKDYVLNFKVIDTSITGGTEGITFEEW